MEKPEKLTIDVLKDAVKGKDAAFRSVLRLNPAGGPGSKVFPPTYKGGVYAWEQRRISKDEVVTSVVLDQVPAQANRMEEALLEAHRAGAIQVPMLEVDFSVTFPDIGAITTLDAPHRIADAIFRDSLHDGVRFRESAIGQAFSTANIRNATALFQHCPNALIFGVWDSTGSAGGLGNKFQRAVVSEIVGFNAQAGVVTSSRIDPLIDKGVDVFETPTGDWTADPDAARVEGGKPVKFKKKGTVAELNLGNVTPDFKRFDSDDKKPLKTASHTLEIGDVLPGGVTISHATQTWVLSLPALRRLCFPLTDARDPDVDVAARAVLAALALAAYAHLLKRGFDLRSRCLLIPEGEPIFELVTSNGTSTPYTLDDDTASAMLTDTVETAKKFGLLWPATPVQLTPEPRLIELVRRSRGN